MQLKSSRERTDMKKHSFVSILRRYWIFYAFFLPVFV